MYCYLYNALAIVYVIKYFIPNVCDLKNKQTKLLLLTVETPVVLGNTNLMGYIGEINFDRTPIQYEKSLWL